MLKAFERFKKQTALLLCVIFICSPILTQAAARSGGTLSGTVRVYLSSMAANASLTLNIAGSYSIGGDSSRALNRGEQITVTNSGSTLYMNRNGVSQAMGSSFKLRRHSTSGENGIRISQARNSANLYPGDLELRARNGNVQAILHVYIEDYLRGVVPYEMSNSFPIEALKAQAVAARTYTLKKMSSSASDYDVVDTASDQAYCGTPSGNANCRLAIEATAGVVGMYGGNYMASYYTASNGGQTESVSNAWNSSSYSYLSVKDDPYDLRNSASMVKSASVYKSGNLSSGLDNLLRTKAAAQLSQMGYMSGSENVTIRAIDSVQATTPKYGSGSKLYTKIVFTARVTATNSSGARENVSSPLTLTTDYFSELESLLALSINSTQNELVSIEETTYAFKIVARRFGHGIGMSQRGAQQMGKEGHSYEQILDFYYPGTSRVAYTFTRSILSSIDGSSSGTQEPGVQSGVAIVSLQNPLESLRLRKEPDASASILTMIPHGTQVTVLDNQGAWCQVQYGTLSGYVMSSYLTFISDDPDPTPVPPPTPGIGEGELGTCTVLLSSGKLNLRLQPSTSSAILALIPNGEVLTLLEDFDTSWVRVRYGTTEGYVSKRYVFIDINKATVTPIATVTPEPTATPTGSVDPNATPTPTATVEATSTPEAEAKTDMAVVILSSENQTLNLRQQPTTASAVLARIRHGSDVKVLANYGAWCSVIYGNLSGFVMKEYLYFPGNFQIEGEATPTPTASPEASPTVSPSPTPDASLQPDVTATPEPTASIDPSVTPEPTPTPIPEPVYLTARVVLSSASSTLNVRAGAGTWFGVLGEIGHGTQVRILNQDPNWCTIDYSGKDGYVATRYLVLDEPTPTQTPTPTPAATATPTPTLEPGTTPQPGETVTPTVSPTPSPSPAPTPEYVSAKIALSGSSSRLNVRASASTNGRILGAVRHGEVVHVYEWGSTWSKIDYAGAFGYVASRYLSEMEQSHITPTPMPTSTATNEPNKTAEPTATSSPSPTATIKPEEDLLPTRVIIDVSRYLNVRNKPSSGGKVIGRVKDGTEHDVTDVFDGWFEIRYSGGKGYVSATYALPIKWGALSTPSGQDDNGATDQQTLTPKPTPSPEQTTEKPKETPTPITDKTQEPAQEQTQEPIAESLPTAKPGKVINSGEVKAGAQVYERADASSSVLLSPDKGESVRVISYPSQREWAYIEVLGVYGYMKLDDANLRYEIALLLNSNTAHNLYKQASLESESVISLNAGTRVSLMDVDGDFALVRAEGAVEGYIDLNMLDTRD